MPARPIRILAVPNDDGFGPSALLSCVVKAILAAEPRATVTIWNEFAFDFNRQLYAREIGAGRVAVRRVFNLVRLARPDGQVSLAGTLELLGDYAALSERYAADTDPASFDLVLDFGAPAAARWAARHSIPSATVFDHSWSKTLELIGGESPSTEWQRLTDAISADERHTGRLYLFPPFLAPPPFPDHWQGLLSPERIRVFDGVLTDPGEWSAARAREFLGIDEDGQTVLIQGGGTDVWTQPLRALLGQLRDCAAPSPLQTRKLSLVVWSPGLSDDDVAGCARVHRLKPVPGGTIQPLLAAVDFAIFRAGGGSVNDAIARRVPFACVREPGQLQIEAILHECAARGLTRAAGLDEFQADPLGLVFAQCDWLRANALVLRSRLAAIPNHAEQGVARDILTMVGA